MDNKTVYDSLRQELLSTYGRQVNLIAFTFTATAALIGYGFSAQKPVIFLLPIIIFWLALVQLNNNLYGIFTISVYIRKSIEASNNFARWEQDISALREFLRTKKPFELLKDFNPLTTFEAHNYSRAIRGMWIACCFLCIWYSVYWHYGQQGQQQLPSIETLFSITFAVGALYLWIRRGSKLLTPIEFINSGEYEKLLDEKWDQLEPSTASPKEKGSRRPKNRELKSGEMAKK
jgi:hypothetical protein